MCENGTVVCGNLSFSWPDGTRVLHGLDWTAGSGRTGLIGLNGAGKSTLLKLLTRELTPQEGTVRITGETGLLPQHITTDPAERVEDVLGVSRRRAALRSIESGVADERQFSVLDDDWDVEQRSLAALERVGLGALGLDRSVVEISGGELVLLHLAAQLLRRPNVLLLDEPTNNLDRRARGLLREAVRNYGGTLIAISHDRELLRAMDRISELRNGVITDYGGNLDHYERALEAEREAAERAVRSADSEVRRQRRKRAEQQEKQARSKRYGIRMHAENRAPRIVLGQRKRAAQDSAGKQRIMRERALEEARARLESAEQRVRDDELVRIDLPATAVPAGRRVLAVRDARTPRGELLGDLELRGPERIALTGPNGAGKSTLLHTVAGRSAVGGGAVQTPVPLRYMPQHADVLDEHLSVIENAKRLAPGITDNEVRARLARFLFTGDRADRTASTLSGGERFRAGLAVLMLAEPAPQLLLLDEPTNNLDTHSVRQLVAALSAYRGALIVTGHDVTFLGEIGITRWLWLDGGLSETDPQRL
ncbi:ABC-F family ATP-binding cassette domain-containing protein [Actinopolyspora saharensis]|uniref:ATPase components of ABC transporters with duplicated ATPase domains n=1 Tax=Actinopolyspora saharensis TaxID=995062 RepID=A0A1H1A5U7_9ACTN|nr:ABC-F family ATP-binding cassette domain-containing protein [Actinopolyspora saharensis]SDQ34871.1 ATPase components of ABC transporters with duplicated ATPase domains [Actinopolyspora saharensis]